MYFNNLSDLPWSHPITGIDIFLLREQVGHPWADAVIEKIKKKNSKVCAEI